MWPPQVVEYAKACIEGLENVLSSSTSRRAVFNQEPLVALRPLCGRLQTARGACLVHVGGTGEDATWFIACARQYEGR